MERVDERARSGRRWESHQHGYVTAKDDVGGVAGRAKVAAEGVE